MTTAVRTLATKSGAEFYVSDELSYHNGEDLQSRESTDLAPLKQKIETLIQKIWNDPSFHVAFWPALIVLTVLLLAFGAKIICKFCGIHSEVDTRSVAKEPPPPVKDQSIIERSIFIATGNQSILFRY